VVVMVVVMAAVMAVVTAAVTAVEANDKFVTQINSVLLCPPVLLFGQGDLFVTSIVEG